MNILFINPERTWRYVENIFKDQSLLFLNEKLPGNINQKLLNFYKGKRK